MRQTPPAFPEVVWVKFLSDSLGIYIHIPFCERKCRYCDFYSAVPSNQTVENYLKSLKEEIKRWGGFINRPIDTIYVGGGTPSVLGSKISEVVNAVRENFTVFPDAEITVEANPSSALKEFLEVSAKIGVNRLSLGVQSGDDRELKMLGRLHTAAEAENCFNLARKTGFKNISLDLMIGLPESDIISLEKSLDFVSSLNPEHISAYILKLEENTPMYNDGVKLPCDDNICEQYLYMCSYLENKGYNHYEVSNFAKKGFESRHNLKYWHTEEYLGIGPSAHSFFGGKRFYYPRDLKTFLTMPNTVKDGVGGGREERLMLALRLKTGVRLEEIIKGKVEFIEKLLENSLARIENGYFFLTDKGMLVQNSIITELLYEDI